MNKTSFVVHGMYKDYLDYAALIAYHASLKPFQGTNTSTKYSWPLKVKKTRKSKKYNKTKTSKRNFPKKMLRR